MGKLVTIDAEATGRQGGLTRAANMTKEQRSASARAAVEARWERYRAAKAAKKKARGKADSTGTKRRKKTT